MNIMILGSGGREHAFAWKIAQSPRCQKLIVAPGNAGTSAVATNIAVDVNDFDGIRQIVRSEDIDLLVVGPEVPLVNGIRDVLEHDPEYKHVKIVGPGKAAAMLEGSKDFAKAFMKKHGIPTAGSKSFTQSDIKAARQHIASLEPPIVLKADGLAAGKGVLICPTVEEAHQEIEKMLTESPFGKASDTVVIEDFLEGIELSVFVLTDGHSYKILPEAKDYKRIGEQDTGPNTGGMGAVSPVHFADTLFMQKVEEQIVKPTIEGLKRDHLDYKGFIFIGLMNVNGQPYVIEYNVRMGDPETQVVLPRIKSDIVDLLEAAVDSSLADADFETDDRYMSTVVMVSGGYPGSYQKGYTINGLEDEQNNSMVFHAGTAINEAGAIVNSGGRVLNVTGYGDDMETAIQNAYNRVSTIAWKEAYFRKDIGADLTRLIGEKP